MLSAGGLCTRASLESVGLLQLLLLLRSGRPSDGMGVRQCALTVVASHSSSETTVLSRRDLLLLLQLLLLLLLLLLLGTSGVRRRRDNVVLRRHALAGSISNGCTLRSASEGECSRRLQWRPAHELGRAR